MKLPASIPEGQKQFVVNVLAAAFIAAVLWIVFVMGNFATARQEEPEAQTPLCFDHRGDGIQQGSPGG